LTITQVRSSSWLVPRAKASTAACSPAIISAAGFALSAQIASFKRCRPKNSPSGYSPLEKPVGEQDQHVAARHVHVVWCIVVKIAGDAEWNPLRHVIFHHIPVSPVDQDRPVTGGEES
jgi:hypothetical protein